MIHAHERRDVERLVELTSEHRRVALLALDHVDVPLPQGVFVTSATSAWTRSPPGSKQ